jgi:RNA polymerase sigma-32 factor
MTPDTSEADMTATATATAVKESTTRVPGREGPLSVLDERALARRWRALNDPKALARLVEAHLGLVIRIAMEFRHSGPSMEDLIQEGNLGLTIAARRFDPNRATRLATYATYWIRACMLEHVVRSHGPVRIGTTRSQRKIFFGLGRARRKLEQGGTAADSEALASELGVLEEDVQAMTPRLTGRDISLDAPRGVDDRRSVGATLAEDAPNPEDMVAGVQEDDHRKVTLFEGLKVLDTRERAIIRARHMRQRPATLAALGKKFGISRERVRQLELRAKAKLRHYCTEPGAPLPDIVTFDEGMLAECSA